MNELVDVKNVLQSYLVTSCNSIINTDDAVNPRTGAFEKEEEETQELYTLFISSYFLGLSPTYPVGKWMTHRDPLIIWGASLKVS